MKKISMMLGLALILGACQNQANQEESSSQESNTNTSEESSESPSGQPKAPADAKVFFANLADGDTLESPFLVQFGVEGMEVEPAGDVHEGKGHHHIIINNHYIEFGGTVPSDSVNIHYGGGQTSDSLDLNPGKYTLTMQFADGWHRSYGKQLSKTIKVMVK
ncbi:DUF4399 domain-containing protein [Croceimicrobium hydrocarbonivorans]|uniref:DUF4399 domain-containing protein n=1 Tax=Croceimicrobium hydrocarbonivorans TaxID=2761580 RepID=A0A7H0VET4_9FLAO|nr:DUF4399 domain-containing protein [Croceimicrobium hydrocarbonivorans]QNR24232.1 DUF4399 domain-containing protein [Croceimicrobium hydrocarbonivorans]